MVFKDAFQLDLQPGRWYYFSNEKSNVYLFQKYILEESLAHFKKFFIDGTQDIFFLKKEAGNLQPIKIDSFISKLEKQLEHIHNYNFHI